MAAYSRLFGGGYQPLLQPGIVSAYNTCFYPLSGFHKYSFGSIRGYISFITDTNQNPQVWRLRYNLIIDCFFTGAYWYGITCPFAIRQHYGYPIIGMDKIIAAAGIDIMGVVVYQEIVTIIII